MWSRERIVEDLQDLRVRAGDAVVVHASMRAIGAVQGGADAVLHAIREVVGPEGTVVAPAFNRANRVDSGADHEHAPGPCVEEVGVLAARLASLREAVVSPHPTHAFSAVGRNAAFIAAHAPFHYPLGSESPLARVHQLDGRILLIGVGHTANAALHLAENWADAPYARRRATVAAADGRALEMEGNPGCAVGFARIEPVLRQARILKTGYVGNAPSQSMRIQHVVSMAMEMLRGDPEALLCDNAACAWCGPARTFTRQTDSTPIG